MLKDLRLAFCSAAVNSASYSQTDAVGYGAAIAIATTVLSALARAIWLSLPQATRRDASLFKLRNTQAEHRRTEIIFNISRFVTSNVALSDETSTRSGASSC